MLAVAAQYPAAQGACGHHQVDQQQQQHGERGQFLQAAGQAQQGRRHGEEQRGQPRRLPARMDQGEGTV
ncbi:hypothetical protein WR25_17197 [Diploscapter pachys]|uniref:Uncharacterized protein n=1 Tax=Diploscapter pachys TaxID=2018661 RepID=A0A2A2M5Z5_9BILA|nr:hypothetical protein WR25_17197 [Diploscapter pachys]